jgi:CheY-like chemotaxis protein
VVLDADPAWAGAAIDGTEVTVVEPGGDVLARLGVTPTRLVVNLAAPGTLAALGALRAAGMSERFWGCLAAPAGAKALPLGMIEPATRPLDPDAVLRVLEGYATRGTRVVTAGADGDTLMSLRHALTRKGLSVSMAWDAKQAADLFDTVRPEVVVLDLELPPRHGYELVVRLAGASPVPSAVLVYGDGDDTGAGFAAALRAAPASALVPRDRLLADVLGRSEVPPEGRPQKKVYALAQRR